MSSQVEWDYDTICQPYKTFHDNVHGNITVSFAATRIIDTDQFQRTKEIHQLGTCHYVFQTAKHTRFEHQIGVYHLAETLLASIVAKSSSEDVVKWLQEIDLLKPYFKRRYNNTNIKFDPYIQLCVKLAGLTHDLGHSAWSHVFDNLLKKKYSATYTANYDHEHRSCVILDAIIEADPILSKIICEDDRKFIKSLIDPKPTDKGFIYQMISNELNGMDVDKMDYLARDGYNLGFKNSFDFSRLKDAIAIDNIICYPKQAYPEIYSMFATRFGFHRRVYCHKTVIAIQYMIEDMLILLNPIFKINEAVNNIEEFCKLTDSYILSHIQIMYDNIHNYNEEHRNNIVSAYQILKNINTRKLYTLGGIEIADNKYLITEQHFVNYFTENKIDHLFDINKIIIYHNEIGFVSGKKENPFNNIYLYNTKMLVNGEKLALIKANPKNYSMYNTSKDKEHILMVFYREKLNNNRMYLLQKAFDHILNNLKIAHAGDTA